MSEVKIVCDYAGIGSILKGSEVAEMLEKYGAQKAINAGSGYSYRNHATGQRTICNVYAETYEAWRDNLKNNTLLRLI